MSFVCAVVLGTRTDKQNHHSQPTSPIAQPPSFSRPGHMKEQDGGFSSAVLLLAAIVAINSCMAFMFPIPGGDALSHSGGGKDAADKASLLQALDSPGMGRVTHASSVIHGAGGPPRKHVPPSKHELREK